VVRRLRAKILPELTEALLLLLSFAPRDVPDDAMRIIERFVIMLYDRTSKYTDIDKARRKLFARNNNVQLIIIIIMIITNKKFKVMLSRKRCRGTLQD